MLMHLHKSANTTLIEGNQHELTQAASTK